MHACLQRGLQLMECIECTVTRLWRTRMVGQWVAKDGGACGGLCQHVQGGLANGVLRVCGVRGCLCVLLQGSDPGTQVIHVHVIFGVEFPVDVIQPQEHVLQQRLQLRTLTCGPGDVDE